jgi:hypothetical protein
MLAGLTIQKEGVLELWSLVAAHFVEKAINRTASAPSPINTTEVAQVGGDVQLRIETVIADAAASWARCFDLSASAPVLPEPLIKLVTSEDV